jgi:putative ABC transport system permease protein
VELDQKVNIGIFTADAISNLIKGITGPIAIVILIVPTIALVVGAIVIMNIMLVAVTERTKEIGIRKSLGARQADILRQFLLEAGTLALLGGFIGLVIAEILAFTVTMTVGIPTSIPIWAIFLAIGVSGGIGILAGLFPAWKAAQLDPIEALRHE